MFLLPTRLHIGRLLLRRRIRRLPLQMDIYLYISMYIQAEYRRFGVFNFFFFVLITVPVISFLLWRIVLLRLRVAEEFLFISARRRAYHI